MGRQYGETNNVKLTTRLPGWCLYLYADSRAHRADKIFIRAELPVKFDRGEYEKDGYDYVLVFCRFKKRYEERFLECMADLERALIMEGHGDYPAFCEEMVVPIIEEG